MIKSFFWVIDKFLVTAILIFMIVIVLLIAPIALLSVGWETGKEIKAGKKIKWWGMG